MYELDVFKKKHYNNGNDLLTDLTDGESMRSEKKFKFSFFAKLFVSFTVISIVPILILGTLTYTISSRVSMNNLESQATDTIDKATASLERTIDEYKSAISYFCNDKEMIDMISADNVTEDSHTSIYQKMFIMMAGKPTTVAMHLIKADGTFSLSTSVIPEEYNVKNHSDWGVFRKLNKTDTTVVYSNRFVSQNGKNYCMAIAHNIRSNGKIIGYIIVDIPADVFRTALDAVNPSLPIKFTVTDENYYLLYDEMFLGKNQTFLDTDFRNRIVQSQQNRKLYLEDPQRFITWNTTNGRNSLLVLSAIPVELVVMSNNYIAITTFAVAIGAILLCLIILPFIIHSLTKPLNAIVGTMNRVQDGDTQARVVIKNDDEFGFIGTSLNSMLDNLNELFQTNLEKQNRLRLAELKALHAQINPHFLYNTLDSIKWLAKLNGVDDIVLIVSQLGRLLKNSINNQRDSVKISEEMALVESYLSIQKIRYGNKFDVDIQVDELIKQCVVPKLIIQPIVENAIIHGIEDKIGKAHLTIRAWKESNKIIFEVTDDGVGISEEDLANIQYKSQPENLGNNSIGLANVDKRIKLYYGKEYGLGITSGVNVGTVTRITMPFSDITHTKDESELGSDD